MPCQILVSYQSARPVGDIIAVVDADHVWGKYESLSAWESGESENTRANWPRGFTVVKVKDRTHLELGHLSEKNLETGNGVYYLRVPLEGTEEYESLNTTGEYECSFDKVEQYLGRR